MAGDGPGQHAAPGGDRGRRRHVRERSPWRRRRRQGYPTLRTHRIGVGLYDLVDGRLVRRETVEVTVVAATRTEMTELAGDRAADVLLLNDEDLTYAKTRLDERSLATVVDHIGDFDNSLARALVWAAAWDMVRDAEMAARDYIALVVNGLPAEHDINLVTATLRQARAAVTSYADPAWAPTGLAAAARDRRARRWRPPRRAAASSWRGPAPSSRRAARATATSDVLAGWLDGVRRAAPGWRIDTELRWTILQALVGRRCRRSRPRSRPSWTTTAPPAANGRPRSRPRSIATPEAQGRDWRRLTGGRGAAELAAAGPARWLPALGTGRS